MGLATLGNNQVGTWSFRIDPTLVSWNYQVKTATIPTIGGKVVQVFGTRVSDMNVTGSFGRGGYAEQMAFLNFVTNQSEAQNGAVFQNTPTPLRFMYPPKKWDFQVYVSAFAQVGSDTSVMASNTDFAPGWNLTLFLVTQNNKLKTAATNAVIARMAAGLGWTVDQFNGPVGGPVQQAAVNSINLGR